MLMRQWKVIREEVMTLVANRVAMTTPQPMKIGAIGGENHEEEEREVKVDAIGKADVKCRRCGGKG